MPKFFIPSIILFAAVFGRDLNVEITAGDIILVVAAHNKCRQDANANPPLAQVEWDEAMAKFAQNHTEKVAENKCPTRSLSGADHSTNEERKNVEGWIGTQLGENGASNMGKTLGELMEAATYAWCGEKKDYIIQNNTSNAVTGHYTQVAWHNVTKVGCGVKVCDYNRFWGYWGYCFCVYDGMQTRGRPYLHGPDIVCDDIDEEPGSQSCEDIKNWGYCSEPYYYRHKCIKTCNGCSKKGGNEPTPFNAEPEPEPVQQPAPTLQKQGTPEPAALEVNPKLCQPSKETVAQGGAGRKEVVVTCNPMDYQGFVLTCKITKETEFRADGSKAKTSSRTECAM